MARFDVALSKIRYGDLRQPALVPHGVGPLLGQERVGLRERDRLLGGGGGLVAEDINRGVGLGGDHLRRVGTSELDNIFLIL